MIVFKNVRIFDGKTNRLTPGSVTVDNGEIISVGDAPPPQNAQIVDGGGHVLMPGLIDAHIHAYAYDVKFVNAPPPTFYAHWGALMLRNMLQRGFTSVRDTGGADYGLAMALQRGYIEGPRLFYCGRALSQTGGHGDMRDPQVIDACDDHPPCGCNASNFIAAIVDGADEVRKAIRENFRRGASFIKIMASGGVASPSDPLHHAQFSDEEILAAVDEVERHDSYCTAHIHPNHAIQRAIQLGIHCIEHGTLIEPDTARMAADRNVSIVPTLAIIAALATEGPKLGFPKVSQDKLNAVKDEAVSRLRHMKDAGVRIGFGTDLLGALERHQCIEFGLRAEVFSPFEILNQATAVNAEILGAKDKLGVIQKGAAADLLLVHGNPLEDLSCLEEDGKHIAIIMKNGVFHKNMATAASPS